MLLKDKRVVIIGGSSGIGFAIAVAAMEQGAHVIIGGRSHENLEKAKSKIGQQLDINPVDIRDEIQLQHFFQNIGQIDHLLLPACQITSGPFLSFSLEEAKSSFDSKFWGSYKAIKQAYPYLVKEGSVILFSGRLSQRPTSPNISIYAAINSAIEGLGRALAVELSPLRVNILSPGITKTAYYDTFSKEEFELYIRRACQESIIRRPAEPEEIAQAAIYLMINTYTTGSTLFVDGGFTFR